MPFQSEKQRKFMWAKHPDIARRWTQEYNTADRSDAIKRRLQGGKANTNDTRH